MRRGLRITILTRISVEEDIRQGTLCALSFAGGGLYIDLDVLVTEAGRRRPAVVAFLAFLEQSRPGDQHGRTAVLPRLLSPPPVPVLCFHCLVGQLKMAATVG